MAILARRLGLNELAQCVSGMAFALSGYLVARSGFLSINATVAWVPWVLLAGWDLAIGSKTWKKSVLLLGILLGLQLLAGHGQTAWYTILLLGIWVLFGAWVSHPRLAFIKYANACMGLASAIALAIVLSAVQVLPTAEYLLQSQRSNNVDYELAMTYSFWPWRLLNLLAPAMFGDPVTGDYWGYANYWEDAIYIGLLPLLLAFGALMATFRGLVGNLEEVKPGDENTSSQLNLVERAILRKRLVLFLFSVTLVSFLLAMGKNTPIFPWLYNNVPSFGLFNAPTRFTLWAIFALALLAGIGAQLWQRPEGRSLYWARLGTAGALSVSLGAGLGWIMLRDINPTFIRAIAMAGFWVCGTGVLTLVVPAKKPEAQRSPLGIVHQQAASNSTLLWSWAVAVFVSADLIFSGWGLNPGVESSLYSQPAATSEIVRGRIGDGRLYIGLEDEYSLKFDRFFRFDTFNPDEGWVNLRATLLPNLNMLEGIPSANNFDPIVPARYSRWMEALAAASPVEKERLLNLMVVTVVESLDESEPLGIHYTYNDPLDRFLWVPCSFSVETGDQALEILFKGNLDPKQVVIIEDVPSIEVSDCQMGEVGSVYRILETPENVEVEVRSEVAGYLVQADTWYPGWQAWIDGERADILRANYLFRAVRVPPGDHIVSISYRPFWFYFGSLISLIAWVLLGIYKIYQSRSVL